MQSIYSIEEEKEVRDKLQAKEIANQQRIKLAATKIKIG